jgi:NRAMP (natural resistance-associated macrophage protein)-like metal ion transporter
VNKLLEITLGIVTAVGGFLEIGSLMTAAQAGAEYGFQLLWAIALGTILVIFLVEMSGRFAAVSGHTIPAAIRERFGLDFFVVPLVGLLLVMLMVLAAEMGGVCIAVELLTGVGYQWWAVPVALLVWGILWFGNFSFIEKGASILGLVTVVFIVCAVWMRPDWTAVAAGFVPSLPSHGSAHYWFIAVSILGASVSPYLMFFYSAGAVEDNWDTSYVTVNRFIAALGMSFGGTIAVAVLIVATLVFMPRGITVDHYDQVALMLTDELGPWGFALFCVSLFIACLGAALELALEIGFFVAQGFGWEWSKNRYPREAARFSAVYSLAIVLGGCVVLAGLDPLKLTVFSMALTAATLPLATVPFLIIMNDEEYVHHHHNGWLSNAVVLAVIVLSFVLAVVTIPLEIFGG